MSLASGAVNNPAINELVQSSLESKDENLRLEWIPCSKITNIKPTQIDNVYNAVRKQAHDGETTIILLCLGNSEECTPTHFRHTSTIMTTINSEDIPAGLRVATNS